MELHLLVLNYFEYYLQLEKPNLSGFQIDHLIYFF